ncbi:MAG: hypothetical protein EOO60_02080 [Hymenobacter sp.]|nr:MAG: hypothetical protein EOO60_02080 [Hymenobacter sp.]
MKHLLLSTLLLASLTSYAQSSPAGSTPLVGTWTLTSKTIVVRPKNGGASTTYAQPVMPNAVKMSYDANGKYNVVFDKRVSGTGAAFTTSGTYAYKSDTITYKANGKISTARVDSLTSTFLKHVATIVDTSGGYVSVMTNTYTR